MTADAAEPGEAEPHPPRDARELPGVKGDVRGDDTDAAPGLGSAALGCSALRRERGSDGDPAEAQLVEPAEVGEDEHADRAEPGQCSRRGSDPGLALHRDHPRPRPDGTLGDGPLRRGADRLPGVCRGHVAATGFVEPRVVGLAHHGDRNHLVVAPCTRDGLEHGVNDRIEHSPDRGGAGQHDRRLERPPLGHRDRAGELATAVEHGVARRHRPFPEGANLVGHDRRHSRAGDAVGFVVPDRDVADAHARNVGDRIVLAGGHRAERQAELAGPPAR